MEPLEYDIEFPRGDTFPIKFRLMSKNKEVLTPSGNDEIYFTIKQSYKTPNFILQKKYSAGDINVEDGILSMILKHNDTANLKFGKYCYDVQIKSGDYVKTVIKGQITLTEEATWIENE